MAKARALDKRRKSIQNTRKITRTMELVAAAQFRKAMERAVSAGAYTQRIASMVADLARAGSSVSHPLLDAHTHAQLSVRVWSDESWAKSKWKGVGFQC